MSRVGITPTVNTYRTTFRLPAAAVLVALTSLATPAHATPGAGEGRASAPVLRTDLDVSLLDKAVHVPLKATLNEVQAPANADRTALTATLDGVDRGRPFTLLRADAATAEATADARSARAATRLAHAGLHVPGLPLLSLVEVEEVTARAVCEAGERPRAEANVLGRVTVLGRKVTLTPGGTTRVAVPAVGEVTLDLSARRTTSRTAAATALSVEVSVKPLKLNVADVTGTLTLAEAACTAPVPAQAADVRPQTAATVPAATPPADAGLAETGAGPTPPYVAAGALALLTAGTAALIVLRRRA
ncbi:SCO1860 family LAETG-anchored protein [Streptomyces sp. NPDC013953]|uniref:SCO1860 family LAETG-anchored protein n=1 Tax=Streptomyces sp. NPDC013953 TaxID=3364868 RepID=UPI0036F51B76